MEFEQIQEQAAEEQQQVVQEQQQVEFSAAEQKAMESGWKPKDQYSGDPDKWVSAEEFNRRGELFDKIDIQNREIKEMRKAMREILEHQTTVREQAYREALKTLKEEKAKAVEEGNSAAFIAAESKEEELKQAWTVEKQEQKAQIKQGPSEVFMNFLSENRWYQADQEKREYADRIGITYAKRLGIEPGTATPEQEAAVLDYVVTKVNEKYAPTKKAAAVEAGKGSGAASTQSQSKGGIKESDLSPTEKRAMENFVRWGVMTKAEYLKSLETAGPRR